MGQEAACRARFQGRSSAGTALPESDALVFRGDFQLAIPFRRVKRLEARAGRLTVGFDGGTVGAVGEGLRAQLEARCGPVASGRPPAGSDLIFLGARAPRELARLRTLRRSLQPNGALWVVWPKGNPELREDDVRAAALRAGLVDVKVVSVSPALSALKLVIPVARR